MSDKRGTFGPLSYPTWFFNVMVDDLDTLVIALVEVDGVTYARCEGITAGCVLTCVINEEYNVQGTIDRIKRTATGWFQKHNITINPCEDTTKEHDRTTRTTGTVFTLAAKESWVLEVSGADRAQQDKLDLLIRSSTFVDVERSNWMPFGSGDWIGVIVFKPTSHLAQHKTTLLELISNSFPSVTVTTT